MMNKSTNPASLTGVKPPPTHRPEDYTGKYTHPAYGDITVSFDNNIMTLTYRGSKMPLEHIRYDTYKAVFSSPACSFDMIITFHYNENGKIDRLTIPIEPGVNDICFTMLNKRE